MRWKKPKIEVLAVGMEIGAYRSPPSDQQTPKLPSEVAPPRGSEPRRRDRRR